MTDYITTNIRLPAQLHRELKRRAAEENKSMAQLLREAAAQYIASSQHFGPSQAQTDEDPLWLIGTDPVDFGVPDASENHDLYLYGPLSESAQAEVKEI